MKAVVTGGAGFIGSHTCEYLLNKGIEVTALDNLSKGKAGYVPKGAVLKDADIRDGKRILEIFDEEKPELLIHLAAQVKVTASVEDPVNDAEINIIGAINLLEAGRRNGLKKVVFASSAAIYGDAAYFPIDERHTTDAISGYGVSKQTVERYLYVYKRLYGIDYAALRYANVYGPRQDSSGEGGVVAIFAEHYAKRAVPTIYGDGEQTRDYVYVKDVARANYMAGLSKVSGKFNVCTNKKTSLNQLISAFNEAYGVDVTPVYAPARKGDILENYMSYNKIKEEIGWEPEYSLKQGLKEILEYGG